MTETRPFLNTFKLYLSLWRWVFAMFKLTEWWNVQHSLDGTAWRDRASLSGNVYHCGGWGLTIKARWFLIIREAFDRSLLRQPHISVTCLILTN